MNDKPGGVWDSLQNKIDNGEGKRKSKKCGACLLYFLLGLIILIQLLPYIKEMIK